MNKAQMRIIKTVGLILTFELLLLYAKAQEQKPELIAHIPHRGNVTTAYSPDERFFVSQSDFGNFFSLKGGKEIKIRDTKTGNELRTFSQHKDCPFSFAISPDSKILAACGKEMKTVLWDIYTGEEVASFEQIGEISFDKEGKLIKIFDHKSVSLWKLESDEITEQDALDLDFEPLISISKFSPNGEFLAFVGKSEDDSNTEGKVINLLNLNQQNNIRRLKGHFYTVIRLVFSPDGSLLATVDEKATIKLWNTKTGSLLPYKFSCKLKQDYFNDINVSFSADGKTLLTTCVEDPFKDVLSPQKSILFWDLKTSIKKHSVSVLALSDPDFLGNAYWGAFGDTPEKSIFTPDLERLSAFIVSQRFAHKIHSLALNRSGNTLLLGRERGKIQMIDVKSGKTFNFLDGSLFFDDFNGNRSSLSLSSDGKNLAHGGGKYGIRIWNLSNADGFDWLGPGLDAPFAFSPDGKYFAFTNPGNETTGDELWLMSSPSFLEKIPWRRIFKQKPSFEHITFSPDNQIVALQLLNNEVKRFLYLIDVKTGKILHQTNKDGYESRALAFSPNGNVLAAIDNNEGIILWNIKTNKIEKTIKSENELLNYNSNSLTFSPDGKFLVTGIGSSFQIWNVLSGKLIRNYEDDSDISEETSGEFRESVESNTINSLAFSPNGKFLVIGRDNGSIQSFQISEDGNFEQDNFIEMNAHTEKIVSVTFSLDSKKIFSSSTDTSIKIWNVSDGKLLATLYATSNFDWLVITPEGLFDGSPNAWRELSWRFNNNTFDYAPVEAFFKEFYYPGLLQEIMQGKTPTPPSKDLSEIDIRQPVVKITEIDGKTTDSANNLSSDKQTVKVRVEIEDNSKTGRKANFPASSDANDLRLFRNGSLVRLWKKSGAASDKTSSVFDLTKDEGCTQIAATKDAPRKAVCETEVSITSGENNFTAYAFNHDDVKSSDAPTVTVKGDFARRDGTLYVLAVGVNQYQNKDYNLNYAVKDVVEIGKTLQENQAKLGNLKQYAKTEIITLTDNSATKGNILNALARLTNGDKTALPANAANELKAELLKIKQTQPEDAVVVYFAGHGVSRGERFYLLPHDFTGEANLLEKQSISDLEINDALEKVDAGKILMVIDACQSGQALGGKNDGRAPMNSKGFAQLAYDKGMLILTAAQSQQAALEAVRIGNKEIRHGLLTYTLLEAIRNPQSNADKDANKQLWEREWFDFAVEQVPLLQMEAMKQRRIDLKNLMPQVKGRSEIVYVGSDNPNLDPNQRRVQTPRVFYRREADVKPVILTNIK
jgi:WD40 repeat protein